MISPELRAVMVGSFFSHVAVAVQQPEKYDFACPRCKSGESGDWNHMMWECKAKPLGPAKPQNVIQRRLAWPMSQDQVYNEAVFRAAEEVVRWAWKYRHGSTSGFDSSNAERKRGAPAMAASDERALVD